MGRASRAKISTLPDGGRRSMPLPFVRAEAPLDDLGVPEEYRGGFRRAREHYQKISTDPTRWREAEVVKTQLLSSYINLAEEMEGDPDPLVQSFLEEIESLAEPLIREARQLARGAETADWSAHEFLFYRLYSKARDSFDKIHSANAEAIRGYLRKKNGGHDPLQGSPEFSSTDYREQALLLHGACVVHETELRELDEELRAREAEVRQRASIGGIVSSTPIISLPRAEWSVLRVKGPPGAADMIPEEADDLLMDEEPGAMGFVSNHSPDSPAFILLGAIESMNKEGSEYEVVEIATHELIHTLQPDALEDQKEVMREMESRGLESFQGGVLSNCWREANTEMLRILRGNPGLAENLDNLSQVEFAYRDHVFNLAEILEKVPPEERLGLVESFNKLGTIASFRALEGILEDPLIYWHNKAREAAEKRSRQKK